MFIETTPVVLGRFPVRTMAAASNLKRGSDHTPGHPPTWRPDLLLNGHAHRDEYVVDSEFPVFRCCCGGLWYQSPIPECLENAFVGPLSPHIIPPSVYPRFNVNTADLLLSAWAAAAVRRWVNEEIMKGCRTFADAPALSTDSTQEVLAGI